MYKQRLLFCHANKMKYVPSSGHIPVSGKSITRLPAPFFGRNSQRMAQTYYLLYRVGPSYQYGQIHIVLCFGGNFLVGFLDKVAVNSEA